MGKKYSKLPFSGSIWNFWRPIMCLFGFHSGKCYDGKYHCSHCGCIDVYSKPKQHGEDK